MRKIMIVAALLTTLAWTTLAVQSHIAYQSNPPQTAGDSLPGGG